MTNNVCLEEIYYPMHDRNGWDCRCKMPAGGRDRLISIYFLRNVFRTHGVSGDEFLACYEGVYKWDQKVKDFVWVGEISKVVTKKVVNILVENYVVYSGNKMIELNPNEVYTVRSESTTYFDDSEAETTIVLQSEGNDPFEIAYFESTKLETLDGMFFYERDYVIISRVSEPVLIEKADYIPF